MDKVFKIGKMVQDMKGNGKMIKLMVKVNYCMLIEIIMRDFG